MRRVSEKGWTPMKLMMTLVKGSLFPPPHAAAAL